MSSQHRIRRILGPLGAAAAIATFLLILLGGVVRITGSGMGCGDHWPLCNGHLIPPMDLRTLIEYGHRLAAVLVSGLVVALVIVSQSTRRHEADIDPEATGSGVRLRRFGLLAAVLLILQILLGAVTVWLELPPASVILHLGTAMLLLATLVVAASEAYTPGHRLRVDDAARLTWWTAVAGFAVVLLGGLTANLHAGPACQGFPFCNGRLWPAGGPLVHVHWTHRLAAYALVGWCLALPTMLVRRRRDAYLKRAGLLVAAAALVQLVIGAAMVLQHLEASLRAAHVGLGALVFVTLVRLAWVATYPPQLTDSSSAT